MTIKPMEPDDYTSALQSLAAFPLLDALFGRRSRRFGVGMSIPDGPLTFASKQPPQALSEVERSILIAAGAGLSGWNLGIPHTESGTPNSGCNYTVRPIGRTFPSGAATQGSELLITDDSGSYITQFRDLDPTAIREYDGLGDLERLLSIVRRHTVKIKETRIELPREYPYISAHNRWVANRPGTTLFIPIGDEVESLFTHLWIRSGEGVLIFDTLTKRVLGKPQALIRAGVLREDRVIPLSVVEAGSRTSVATELSIAAYNIQLLLQAIGLGGWLFSGLNTHAMLGSYADNGVPGFGFRFARSKEWSQPNPLGLDTLFEPLIPPYVRDMAAATEIFVSRKFGQAGTHEPWRPGPYLDNAAVKASVDRPDQSFINYIASVAQDIYDIYGKFPASHDSVGIATYTQAQHIDLEFYDTFYGPDAYLHSHAQHEELWHGVKSPI